MVTAGILPFRENSHGRTGNRTRDLIKLWPLDHEAGLVSELRRFKKCTVQRLKKASSRSAVYDKTRLLSNRQFL